MDCLLVIPHFQHLDHLRRFLPTLTDRLDARISILVSDDGSGPDVARSLESFLASERERTGRANLLPPLVTAVNRGKGHAVYAGWRAAGSEEWLAFVDADGAVSVDEINRAWTRLCDEPDQPDILIGSRVAKLGRNVERTFFRHASGRIFATIASVVSGLTVYDSQCGLKFIRAAAFRRIEPFVKADRFSFDMELLMLASAAGCGIEEFPIDWHHVPGGKVSVLRHSLPMLAELLRARRNVSQIRHALAA